MVGTNVIAIEGAQFEDGLRRIVVGPEISAESMKAIEEALRQLEFEEDRRRWLLELLSQKHATGGPTS